MNQYLHRVDNTQAFAKGHILTPIDWRIHIRDADVRIYI